MENQEVGLRKSTKVIIAFGLFAAFWLLANMPVDNMANAGGVQSNQDGTQSLEPGSRSTTISMDMLSAGAFVTFGSGIDPTKYSIHVTGWNTAGAMFSAASTPIVALAYSLDCATYPSNITAPNVANSTTGRVLSGSGTSLYPASCLRVLFTGATPTTTAVATVILKYQP